MSLMFEYRSGMSLTDPWPFTVVRASPAYFIDSTGTLVQAAANVIRDRHYPLGRGSAVRTTLFEPTAINRIRQSQAWATAPWGNNVVTATNNNAAAPDLTVTATKLLPNNTGANNNPYVTQAAVTITSAEFVAASFFVKANGYGAVVLRFSDASSTVGFHASFDLSAGSFGSFHQGFGGGVLTGFASIPLANGWYWIGLWGQVNGGVTAGSLFCYVYDTIAHANAQTAYTADGVSSVLGWGAQVERNGATPRGPTSYMLATAADSTARGNDSLSALWPYQTMPMWSYASYYDLGGHIALTSSPIITLCDGLNHDPAWCGTFMRNSGAPGASWGSGAGPAGLISSNRNTVDSGLAAVQPYDFVEVFSQLLGDGSTKCAARKNGGAISSGGPAGPVGGTPFVDIKGPVSLFLGYPGALNGPQCGLLSVKIGADPARITTLALAAAA